jgi:type II secretory pathway component PulF
MCLEAGIAMRNALRTCQRTFPHPRFRAFLQEVIERVDDGAELSAALEPWRARFPAFFLPVLRCGERSGRLDATLAYLEHHCHMLVGPARTVRNTWFVPLCIMAFGSAFGLVAHMLFAPPWTAFHYALQLVKFYGILAAAVWAAVYVPAVREVVDQLRLMIPLLGTAERQLAFNRFFHAMNLLYSTSGLRVEQMVRWAAESTGNRAVRADFLRAADRIEAWATIYEAFRSIPFLSHDYKGTILTGEESGKLDTAFDTICRLSNESIERQLVLLQQILFRLCALAVIMSIVGTLNALMAMRQ